MYYSLQLLSQFMDSFGLPHLDATQKVLRYIKRALGQSLLCPAQTNLQLIGYCDSDWGSCQDARRFVSGYCVFIGSFLVSRKCKRQGVVSRSSAKAEYQAMANLCCELTWMRYMFIDLQIKHLQPTTMFYDNKPALYIASNLVIYKITKHIELDCHLMLDKIQNKSIVTAHTNSGLQIAYLQTKALSSPSF